MTHVTRPMRRDDVEFALSHVQREGWDVAVGCFQMHLEHDLDGCFVAELDGRRAGMVTSTVYGDGGFIGNLIVDPAARRRGIGEALMRCALKRLQERGIGVIQLEADPPGVRLYQRLRFVDAYESVRFAARSPSASDLSAIERVQHLKPTDLPALLPLDARSFGDDRRVLLGAVLEHAVAALWIEAHDGAAGYVMVQQLLEGYRIGPFVARDPAAASRLLDAALLSIPDGLVHVGLPDANEAGIGLLNERGFQPRPGCRRMVLDGARYDEQPQRIFAIAGGDCG